MPERPYLYYDLTLSLCATCLRRVEAKVVVQDGKVYLLKRCPAHGPARVLVADDADYYRRAREAFLKPSEMPLRFNTPERWGCPYDCGLCPGHEQHTCLGIVEVNDHCNLRCPVCYASSGPERPEHRPLAEVERMLDALVANEGTPDVVQVSGGEPTLHPDFFAILDAARKRPLRHLMVNTNGVRIAQDAGFAARLASYGPGFEVYLQFDSLREGPLRTLRGADLREVRRKALDRLDALGLSTTLVVTVMKGVNDGELGELVDFALTRPCVRGVTFQPVQRAGRADGYDPAVHRLTLTEVRRRILEQTTVFRPEDVLPVPCHPDAIAMAYALKTPGGTKALTGLIDPAVLIGGGRNTIVYEKDGAVRDALFRLLSTGNSPQGGAARLKDLLCCLPRLSAPTDMGYKDLFRVIIMQFMDAESFDVRSVKKSCVHMVRPDGRIIPFETYNLFYRDGLEESVLAPLRAGRQAIPSL